MNIIYEGFFIINELDSRLEKDIENKHITTEYRPKKSHEHLYGERATFAITGYGCDGQNEGYSVTLLSCDNEELVNLFNQIPVPHITLSVSREGRPKDTCNLTFEDYRSNTIIKTVLGGFNGQPVLRR